MASPVPAEDPSSAELKEKLVKLLADNAPEGESIAHTSTATTADLPSLGKEYTRLRSLFEGLAKLRPF